jgi:hypothetical protein
VGRYDYFPGKFAHLAESRFQEKRIFWKGGLFFSSQPVSFDTQLKGCLSVEKF